MTEDPLATAAAFLHRDEAEIAGARLRAEGIDAMVVADDEGGLNPGFFSEYRVRVVVRREDVTAARTILGDVEGVDGVTGEAGA